MYVYKLGRLVLATAMLSPVILAAGSIVAEAADASRPAYRVPPPPPPLYYNWTGLYAGVHVGGGWSDLGLNEFGFIGSNNNGSGAIAGGQIGYNFQVGQYVWGLEADVAGTSVKNNFSVASINWNSVTTLTSRFGYAADNWLLYGKAGAAWADVSTSVLGFDTGGGTGSGWVVGVGAEYAFRNNWSAKVEYNHADFGSDGFLNSVTFDAVKVGVNYKFGMPGSLAFPF
jgi:outer membrane immunogenic protein